MSKNKYNISAPTLDNWEIKSTGSSQFRKENGRFIDKNSGKTDGAYGNNSHYTAIATRVFYDNRTTDTDGFLAIEPTMISNNWGPVEFVIAHAESITPKNPTGIYGDRVKSTNCEVYLGNVLFPDNKLDSVNPFKIECAISD